MKTLLSVAAIGLLALTNVSLAADEKDALIAREKAAWQNFQDKKTDAFRKIFAEDYRGVYSDGIKNADAEVAGLGKSELKSFALNDVSVVFPDKDTAVIIYKVTTQGTMDGKDVSGTYNAASVWHKHTGEWHVVLHTDIKAE